MKDKDIVVWFSCGAASAVAAKKTIELYGQDNRVRVVNNPVLEEDEDNLRFLDDVQEWIQTPIETAYNNKYPLCSAVDVWARRAYMAGPKGAPCTLELKKNARVQFEMDNDIDYHVLGFVKGEEKRFKNFSENERPNSLPVLIDACITKDDCYRIIMEAGIDVPNVYKMGYPNANCIGCVKASSSTYWNHVRKTHPHVFQHRSDMSRELGAKLVWYKGKRIFLDELPADAKGHPMKSMDVECGIFCVTK